jgi:hypothetical protein
MDGTDNIYRIGDTLSAGSIMTVTLTWFRERDLEVQSLVIDDVGEADLDLIVRDTISGQIISESISAFNNVEHFHFALPRTSNYQIEVQFFGALFGNLTSEDYGLAWSVAVPEPTSGLLLLVGLAMLARLRRR